MLVTAELLTRDNACIEQVQGFREVWPEGVEVTPWSILKAEEVGLDTVWFRDTLIDMLTAAVSGKPKDCWVVSEYQDIRRELEEGVDYYRHRCKVWGQRWAGTIAGRLDASPSEQVRIFRVMGRNAAPIVQGKKALNRRLIVRLANALDEVEE